MSDFNERYNVAAVYADERRIRRAAAQFWRAVAKPSTGWLQPHEGEEVRRAMAAAFDGVWMARDVAMVLDMAPDDADFRVKASVGYWLRDSFAEVCNA